MQFVQHPLTLSATALAAALLLSACGGDASPPADTTPPTVTITDDVSAATATGNVTFTFTFSEAVSGFTADDVSVTGGTKGTFTMASNNLSATLVVTPAANSTGTINVNVAANTYVDQATNANTTSTSASQAYNTIIPVPSTTIATFDESTAPGLTGFGGAEDSSIAADPTNASNKVAKIVKSSTAELWAGTTVSICSGQKIVTLPFSSTNKTMTAKVYSPRANVPVRLKVEDASDANKSVETEATVTQANTWQTLTFNFDTQATGTAALNLNNIYNKVSVFFDFGKTGAAGGSGTFYFDDLKFNGSSFSTTCPVAPTSSFPLTFDNSAVTYALTGFGGAEDSSVATDPTSSTNKVAKTIKSVTAELWAGTTISTGATNSVSTIPFSNTQKTMTLRVYSPVANIPVRLKVEDASDSNKSVETEATVTQANTWQTLTFNFSNQVTGTAALNLNFTYNKVSVFFNFGTTGANGGGGTFYYDDLSFGN